ncbi:hypothetical protein F5Y03DRAFT_341691 [Xylaria venustula]|nr:hypothetical protein F5Y03DRAFT_341691 [Xylaria venustula]
MTTSEPTPSPTLQTDWTPTSSGCLRTSDLWIWDFGNTRSDARTVVGGPSQTTDCFASEWNPTVTYAAAGCPSHYTSACSSSGAVTCCPTIYDFDCQPETAGTDNHIQWFRCQSLNDGSGAVTVTRTNFIKSTQATETRTSHTYEHLFALGVMYNTPFSTPSATTSPTTSSTSSANSSTNPSLTDTSSKSSSSGLTAGAAAGIGVGVAAGVIILALLGWLMFRRRRASKVSNETLQFSQTMAPVAPMSETSVTYNPGTESFQGPAQYLAQPLPTQPPKELPAESPPVFELDSQEQWRR